MDLSGIISIAGMSGLYKVIAQTKSGLIVESLIDKKRVQAFNTNKISALADVSMYSTGDDVPLKDVFQKIYDKEKGGPCLDHKSADAELKKYFKAAFPEYDEDRVYVSDIRKVLNWYNLLQKDGLLDKKEESDSDKPKLKAQADAKGAVKTVQDSGPGKVKTAGTKVKTQGVRKTGVA
ncbi:MAG: DUF5606 domain-containing protein [Bacteroidia bacterium]